MTITAAKLMVEIGAETTEAQRKLASVSQTFQKLAGDGIGLRNVLGGVLGANLITSGINALQQLGAEAWNVYAGYERLGNSLSNLVAKELLQKNQTLSMSEAFSKAAPMAKELQSWISKLAIESPFDEQDVSNSFRLAMAYGFTTQEAKRMTQAMLDFAAGSGATSDVMNQVSLALGQIRAKGKLSGQEILQLVNAGVNVYEVLSGAFGKSTAEITKMIEKGLIPADDAINAILSSFEEFYGGAGKRGAETISGLTTSLAELKSISLREFTSGAIEELRPFLIELTNLLSSETFKTQLQEWGKQFANVVKDIIEGIRSLVTWFSGLDEGTQKLVLGFGAFIALRPLIFGTLSDIVGGASKIIGILPNLATGMKAFQSGMSLTTALGAAGLSPIAITLGSIALAVGAVVAVWAQWNKQIVQTNKKGVEAVKSTWSDFFEKQISTGKNATEILNEYRAAQERVNNNLKIDFKQGGIAEIAKLFVDKKGIAAASADELSNALLRASTSYTEYAAAMQSAGLADSMLTQTEYLYRMKQSLDETSQSLTDVSLATNDMSGNLAMIGINAQAQIDELGGLIDQYDALKSKMDDWVNNTASEVHAALGQRFVESSTAFREALGVVDEVLGTNYTSQLEFKDAVQSLVDQYARTKDLSAFKDGLQKIKDEGLADMQSELENVTTKAQELYDKLLALPQEIKIKIGFDVQSLPSWIIGTGGTTTNAKPPKPSLLYYPEERASGGPVESGQLYLVGERGPELFIPRQSGTIVPNATSGMTIQNVQVIFRDTAFTPESFGNALKQLEWMYS